MKLCSLAIILLVVSGIASGQSKSDNVECTSDSILMLGNKKDGVSLSKLRQFNKSENCAAYREELDLALAKRGDGAKLREVICGIWTPMPNRSSGELEYIGGWFGIRAALVLMDQQERYLKTEFPPSDVVFTGSPRSWGIRTLRSIIKKGPSDGLGNPDEATEEALRRADKVWRRWIAVHKKELQSLAPVGTGVSFSACE